MMADRLVKDNQRPAYNCTFSFATGAATHSSCTISVKDDLGNAIGEVMPLMVWMSSVATGVSLPAVGPTNLAALAGGGTYMHELVANQMAIVLTNGAGQFVLDITDAVTMTDYVVATPMCGLSGFINVSRVMSAADFGV